MAAAKSPSTLEEIKAAVTLATPVADMGRTLMTTTVRAMDTGIRGDRLMAVILKDLVVEVTVAENGLGTFLVDLTSGLERP